MPAPRAMMSGRTFSEPRIRSSRARSTLRSLPRMGRMAWKRRARPRLAAPPAEASSTMASPRPAAARPVVEACRERGPEARHVGAAVDGVDVVGEGEDVLRVGIVVLERHLDGRRALLAIDVDRALVDRLLVLVQMAHEAHQATLEVERLLVGRLGQLRAPS